MSRLFAKPQAAKPPAACGFAKKRSRPPAPARYSSPMARRVEINPKNRHSVLSRRKRGAVAAARVVGVALTAVIMLVLEGKPGILQKVDSNEAVGLLALFFGATAFVIWAVRTAKPTDANTRGFDVIPGPPREAPPK